MEAITSVNASDQLEGKNPIQMPADILKSLSEPNAFITLGHIFLEWTSIIFAISISRHFSNPLLYLFAVIWIAARQHGLLALMHEGTHFRVLPKRFWNDVVSEIFLSWPLFITTRAYRDSHFLHHRFVNTDQDPDWYSRRVGVYHKPEDWKFPKPKGRLASLLFKDILGLNTYYLILDFVDLWRKPKAASATVDHYVKVRVAFYLFSAFLLSYFHAWGIYALYWLVPAFTWLKALLRIRSMAEHFGLKHESQFTMTRTLLLNPLERLLFIPKNMNYHLDHHLFPTVPFFRLPSLHRYLKTNRDYKARAHITKSIWGMLQECSIQRGRPLKFRSIRRRTLYYLGRILPVPVRRLLFFKAIKYYDNKDQNSYTVEIANSPSDYEQAFELVWNAYSEENFVDAPKESEQCKTMILLQQLLPSTEIVVVKKNDRVVATMSLYGDNPLKLPSDKMFHLEETRQRYGYLVEAGAMAVHQDFRRQKGSNIVFDLMSFAHNHIKTNMGGTAVIVSVYPYHCDFYRFLFYGSRVPGNKTVTYFGKPAIVMIQDVKQAQADYEKAVTLRPPAISEFYRHISGQIPPYFKMASKLNLQKRQERMVPLLLKIIERRPQFLNDMNFGEFAAFHHFFSDMPTLAPLFELYPDHLNLLSRRNSRKHILLPARLETEKIELNINILNMSLSGILVHSELPIDKITGPVHLIINGNNLNDLNIAFKVVRVENRFLGLELCSGENHWRKVFETVINSPVESKRAS